MCHRACGRDPWTQLCNSIDFSLGRDRSAEQRSGIARCRERIFPALGRARPSYKKANDRSTTYYAKSNRGSNDFTPSLHFPFRLYILYSYVTHNTGPSCFQSSPCPSSRSAADPYIRGRLRAKRSNETEGMVDTRCNELLRHHKSRPRA